MDLQTLEWEYEETKSYLEAQYKIREEIMSEVMKLDDLRSQKANRLFQRLAPYCHLISTAAKVDSLEQKWLEERERENQRTIHYDALNQDEVFVIAKNFWNITESFDEAIIEANRRHYVILIKDKKYEFEIVKDEKTGFEKVLFTFEGETKTSPITKPVKNVILQYRRSLISK